MLLTKDGRLIFLKRNGKYDEEIKIRKDLKVVLKQEKKFTIKSSRYLKTIESDDAKTWVHLINGFVKK